MFLGKVKIKAVRSETKKGPLGELRITPTNPPSRVILEAEH